MWADLSLDDREKYRELITNYASLSEAFAQKEDDSKKKIIAPIINSKYQESAFKRAFNATIEDIGNSSFDASIKLENGEKYIVGIKSFGMGAGYQKIAQFKSDSFKNNWNAIIDRIKKRSRNGRDAKDLADYLKIVQKIAYLRNKRINSSKSKLRGFKFDDNVNAVYHVLMPSKAIDSNKVTDEPFILVGETMYNSIDINTVIIDGPTRDDTLQNFRFHDKYHQYQYNSADSQLLMSFRVHNNKSNSNENIKVDKWNITYIEDPLSLFENLNTIVPIIPSSKKDSVSESYTFMITPELRSGFNAWYGAPKSKLKVNSHKYKKIYNQAKQAIENKDLSSKWFDKFKKVAFKKFNSNAEKMVRENLRKQLIDDLNRKKYPELFKLVTTSLWRNYDNPYEVYLPIPNAKKFNNEHPNFFAEKAGLLAGKKLVSLKENRIFTLECLPSGERIEMFINQDNGKAIQSISSQFIFGKWVLKNIFQLEDRELLTSEVLESIGINAMTFSKYESNRPISMEFTYVAEEDRPTDLWE